MEDNIRERDRLEEISKEILRECYYEYIKGQIYKGLTKEK